jgi:hypothetical protein
MLWALCTVIVGCNTLAGLSANPPKGLQYDERLGLIERETRALQDSGISEEEARNRAIALVNDLEQRILQYDRTGAAFEGAHRIFNQNLQFQGPFALVTSIGLNIVLLLSTYFRDKAARERAEALKELHNSANPEIMRKGLASLVDSPRTQCIIEKVTGRCR